MANKPQDRYPTPQALASDIEHWLADEPVAAWREPLAVRTRRWARRHRTLVTSAAALFLASVIAGSLGFVALSREQAATETARAEAVAAAQTATAQTETTQAVSGFLKGMFEEPTPYAFFGIQIGARDIDPAAEALLDRAAQRLLSGELDSQPHIKASMLATIGRAYAGVGMLDRATPLLEKALDEQLPLYPHDSPEVADAILAVSQTRFLQGRSIEAEELAIDSLGIQRKLHGDRHEAVVRAKATLGVVYGMTGVHSVETDILWREILDWRKHNLPKDDPAIAEALIALAGNSLWQSGQNLSVAIPHFMEATRIFNANAATRELGAAISGTQQAVILDRIGNKQRAFEQGRVAYDRYRKFLGDHHPVTVVVAGFYGRELFNQGREPEAQACFDRLLELFLDRGIPFLEPSQEQQILRCYVTLRTRSGANDVLEATLRSVYDRHRQVAGCRTDNGHAVLAYLAKLLHNRGCREEADALVKQHIAGISGADAVASNRYLRPLAAMLHELGYLDEEQALLEKNVDTARGLVDRCPTFLPGIAASRRLDLALQLDRLGGLLRERKRPSDALQRFREALDLRREIKAHARETVAWGLDRIAECERDLDLLDDAERHLEESIEIKRQVNIAPGDLAWALATLGHLHNQRHQCNEAIPLFVEAAAIHRKAALEGKIDIAWFFWTTDGWVNALRAARNDEKVEEILRDRVVIAQQVKGKEYEQNEWIARAMHQLSVHLLDQGKANEAKSLFEQIVTATRDKGGSEISNDIVRDAQKRLAEWPSFESTSAPNQAVPVSDHVTNKNPE